MLSRKEGELMNEELFWNATLSRDPNYDGKFVYGVRSTGIYCRPTCPSKRPLRNQVSFYSQPEFAEKAGFRACKRCEPRGAEAGTQLVQQICSFLEANPEQQVTLTKLSNHTGISAYHLQRTFKQRMGITPRQYADSIRLGSFKQDLRKGNDITGAMYDAGYGSSSRLYERAHSQLGMTPATYRRGGKGMRLQYAITDSPLRRLLVAATKLGICAVSMGDSDKALTEALSGEYPNAEISQDSDGLGRWLREFSRHLDGKMPQLNLPVDVQATAFQRRVWEELRKIPYGSTRSYSEIARKIGKPSATRAVARACATNPVALIVPCHRVVREDGTLGGYRWGLNRKRMLLEKEERIHRRGTESAEGGKE